MTIDPNTSQRKTELAKCEPVSRYLHEHPNATHDDLLLFLKQKRINWPRLERTLKAERV